MLPNNIQSYVAHQAIKYIKDRDDELNDLKNVVLMYTDKCANFDIKCKRYIQKHLVLDNQMTMHTSVDISGKLEICDICSFKICDKCCNKQEISLPINNELNVCEIDELDVYEICDVCYKQMCFTCLNKYMTFCNDCKIACICKVCSDKKQLCDQWTCNYCINHPRWWDHLEPKNNEILSN